MKRIFAGSLAPETREEDIQELFSAYGTVRAINVARDVFTGNCRGFAFIDMEGHEARAAIAGLDGSEFKGRAIRVNEERSRGKRKGRGRR